MVKKTLISALSLLAFSGVAFGVAPMDYLEAQKARFDKLYSHTDDTEQDSIDVAPAGEVSIIEKPVEHAKLNALIEGKLKALFGEWKQVFAKDFKIAKVAGAVKFHELRGINKYWTNDKSLDVAVEWRFAIKYPWIKNIQYAGATTMIKIQREMLAEPNMIRLHPRVVLGLGKGWEPEEEKIKFLTKGFSRKWLRKIGHWVVRVGIEETFRFWSKKVNAVLAEKVGPMLPKVNGSPQQLAVLSMSSYGRTVNVEVSSLVLNLKELLKSQLPADSIDRLTIKDLKTAPDSTTLVLEMEFLSAPSNIVITPGDGQVTVNWDAVPGATGYNLYYSTSPWMAPSTQVAGVTGPHTLSGLTNGTMYYFSMTAVDSAGESGFAPNQSATPQGAEPEQPPAEEPPTEDSPIKDPPTEEPPSEEPPSEEPPATEPPSEEPPATEPPAEQEEATQRFAPAVQ